KPPVLIFLRRDHAWGPVLAGGHAHANAQRLGGGFVLLVAAKGVSQLLVMHKLRELRRPRLARLVRACAAASLAGVVAVALLFSLHVLCMVLWRWEEDLFAVAAFFPGLVALVSYPVSCGAGLWGLLAGAARAWRFGSALQRKAALFAGLTAACQALSFSSTFLMWAVTLAEKKAGWFNWATCVDALFDCLCVALFSGLVGPPWLQRLAQDSFEAINSYSSDQLQEFYEEFLAYLEHAQVKWVRCRYLRRLAAEGRVMTRCQEVPPHEAICGSAGFPLSRDMPKDRFVLSHPWLSREHPDPEGVKLQELVRQLNLLGASDADAVFVDFMSLPQNDKAHPELRQLERAGRPCPDPGCHPAVRTAAEERLFKRALSAMEQVYSTGSIRVIVLPMDSSVEAGREYIKRGWCFLEFCLALSFGNICNAEIAEPVALLAEEVKSKRANTVDGFRSAFQHTHFTNKGDADVVLELFENTLDKQTRH
ncbi:unnamed protein product, partial [Prorocentrum cordatum]